MRRNAEAVRADVDEFMSQVERPMPVMGCVEQRLADVLMLANGVDHAQTKPLQRGMARGLRANSPRDFVKLFISVTEELERKGGKAGIEHP
jgi:hypothetical protein